MSEELKRLCEPVPGVIDAYAGKITAFVLRRIETAIRVEREACAVMFDNLAEITDQSLETWRSTQSYMWREGRRAAFRCAAAAIRGRGEAK